MTTLAELVEIVRQSRERTAGVFPLPDVDSCIDYAITEAGEYLDAVLREKRDTDKRNRDKDHDARKEWGQCGYMIASALIQLGEFVGFFGDSASIVEDDDFANYLVMGDLILYRIGESKESLFTAWALWVAFCNENRWIPGGLLRETCAAFEAKHLPVVRGYDFEPVGKLFRYPVMSAEDAAKQGEQAE